uniref:Uncharacterized protein n=1 Tax=Schistosoma haematobium TaxID=6185 RepID=A0A095C5M2_SCHHA
MQALTWNPQHQRRSKGRTKNNLHYEMETDMRKMNNNCIELGRKAQDRVGWRMLIGVLFSIGSNRCKSSIRMVKSFIRHFLTIDYSLCCPICVQCVTLIPGTSRLYLFIYAAT